MSHANQTHSEVLIVGGGPVGMGLAIELGQRGVSVTVVERHQKPQRVPKGQNLTQRSGEHFRAWGVSRQIRAAAPIPHEFGSAGLTAYGTLLGEFSYDWFRRAAVRPYYFADNERLPQYETEAVLRTRVEELDNVQVFYGWAATGVTDHGDHVSAEISRAEGAETRRLTAEYAVGCDGSGSLVRAQAAIAEDAEPHDKHMVLVVFKSIELHRLLERYGGKSYFNVINPALEGYWQFLGRVDLNGGWFFHAPVPHGTTRDNCDFAELLHGVVGAEFALEFEHIGFWDLRFAIAKTYRAGRVFVAGDAAHSHPPYGGFGINTGFEDARNLGWKLAARLQGWGGEALLDSYDAERRPVFQSTADDFIRRLIADDRDFIVANDPDTDPAGFAAAWEARAAGGNADVTAFAPHYEGSPVIYGGGSGPPSAVGQHTFEAMAGQHLPPLKGSENGDLFAEMAAGFALISAGGSERVLEAFRTAADGLGVPLHIIKNPGESTHKARYILVRPDHFVGWVGSSDTVDTAEILGRVVGRAENP